MSTPFLDTARRVIRTEATALNTLADMLDDSFRAGIDLLNGAKGRVIVTGIGKSGHIANKIAATLASTGTPAQFVHPAEASHGDLGMITAADVVLAISNSGEAPELANLIAYSRRFDIPLVGITSRADSSLGNQCDVVLLLPRLEEACGTGIVPTTSTTMTLAMGDALAVALMENRAFSAEHFRAFHPGGKLGAQLSLVSDLMHSGDSMPLIDMNAPMSDVLTELGDKAFGVVIVINDAGQTQGIITVGDLSRNMEGLLSLKACDVMTKDPIVISPSDLAEKAVGIMNTRKITCLLVADPAHPQKPAGLLHIHDCLRVGLS
ncbi:KpsF/GutQ family sugar-phosphate isomerase [Sulfitobacter sp. SK012]|uniref:KpsF/GutQ family sugar-phosphate isomerase n=1 Tax=Sulfitobacter sp. SK012 TaxID=1389005 RepID=UPI000E0C3F8B|nr:KpsF/GutQ family sugar-phosphate isomerase [Sulfitobacter sp. SK012]AXI44683.1 KpsF/GutQ family sugar-phosphate isomerase [Sulfitobacter sp. SK012]